MKTTKTLLKTLVLSTFSICSLQAQDIDKNEVEFEYIRLPLKPIEKTTKNYDVAVIQNADVKNAELKAKYEAKKKEADDDYNKKLTAQDEMRKSQKSKVGSILVSMQQMDDKNKITKEVVPEPVLLKTYPKEVVAGRIKLSGYTKSAQNAVLVTTNLLGFDMTDPTYSKSGQEPNFTYSYSFEYRNPVSIKIDYNGKSYMDEVIPATNSYAKYNSKSFKTETEAKTDWVNSSRTILEQLQNSSIEKSLDAATNYIDPIFGYMKLKREALIFSVKSKKVNYADYIEAFTILNEGYLMLGEDMMVEDGKTKIKQAVDKFETILKESNVTDKKARINEDVTIATYFNLLEANIWLNDFMAAQKYILKLKTSDTNRREERRMERIKELLVDQKQRFEANKQ